MRRTLMTLTATGAALALALPVAAGPQFRNKYDDVDRWYVCYEGNDAGTVRYGSYEDAVAAGRADARDVAGYVGYDAPLAMWPPNHKMQPTTFYAVPDGEDDGVNSLATTGTHDEYAEDGTEMNGAGNTDGDVTDNDAVEASTEYSDGVQTTHDIRSERSGRGDGRRYDMDVTEVTFGDGDDASTCAWTGDEFDVLVPHDMRGGADWDHGNGGGNGNGNGNGNGHGNGRG